MKDSPRGHLLNMLLVVGSLTVALPLVNVLYWTIEPIEQREMFLGSQYTFFRYDPLLGWSNLPGAHGILERSEFRTMIDINADGMRYGAVGPKQGLRVAVLGDSFTWGHGVKVEERFTDIVEKQLGVEILNFGVSGYGPVQYLQQLDHVLTFKPDLVIVAFCLANDFGDSVVSYRHYRHVPYGTLADGKLEVKGYPIPDSGRFGPKLRAAMNDYALGRLLFRVWRIPLGQAGWDAWQAGSHRKQPPKDLPEGILEFDLHLLYEQPQLPEVKYTVAVTEALMKAIRDRLKTEGIPLVVLAVPTKTDVGDRSALMFLKEITRRLNIPLKPKLQTTITQEDFFIKDDHWNASGHAKAAELLGPIIEGYAGKAAAKKP